MSQWLSLLALAAALLGGAPDAWAALVDDGPHESAPAETLPPAEEMAEAEGDCEPHGAAVELAETEPRAAAGERRSSSTGPPPVPPPR
ncbi:hypothetical protein [Rubrivirga sp. IMCC43871]|uniref:hypothetical protein n=1 Tax=Rubrivirga sp. IMCC43871 TaxID=3391575 RepID=UPI00398FEA5D